MPDGRFNDNDARFPYTEHHHVWDVEYDFLIVNDQAESWYGLKKFPEGYWQQWAPDMKHFIKPNQTIIDCGAHHGHYALAFAKSVGPRGSVFAIEADPYNFHILEQNIQLNHLEDFATPIHAAVYNEMGKMLDISAEIIRKTSGPIPSITIDSLSVAPDFIKVDVEGLELLVIQGGIHTINTHRPIISLDIHLCGSVGGVDMRNDHGLMPADLQQIFDEMNYQLILDGKKLILTNDTHLTLRGGTFAIPKENKWAINITKKYKWAPKTAIYAESTVNWIESL